MEWRPWDSSKAMITMVVGPRGALFVGAEGPGPEVVVAADGGGPPGPQLIPPVLAQRRGEFPVHQHGLRPGQRRQPGGQVDDRAVDVAEPAQYLAGGHAHAERGQPLL